MCRRYILRLQGSSLSTTFSLLLLSPLPFLSLLLPRSPLAVGISWQRHLFVTWVQSFPVHHPPLINPKRKGKTRVGIELDSFGQPASAVTPPIPIVRYVGGGADGVDGGMAAGAVSGRGGGGRCSGRPWTCTEAHLEMRKVGEV
eukprot:755589-Hanusia_phi.AAC.5